MSRKILITVPDLEKHGGVANYYRTLRPHLPDTVRLQSIGSRLADTRLKSLLRPLIDFLCLLRIIPRFQLVHVNPSLGYKGLARDAVTLLLARFFRKKTVVFFRGWDLRIAEEIEQKHLKWFAKFYFKVGAVIVLASDFEKDLRRWGYTGRVLMETTAVEDCYKAIGQNRAKTLKSISDLNVLFMARLVDGKGAGPSAEAVTRLIQQEHIPALLHIAGEGSLKSTLEEKIQNGDLSGVKLVGYLAGEEKQKALSRADVFLFPTVYGEGMPNVVLEAMVAGLPVITTSVGGVKDFFEDGKMGFLVDGHDVQQITDRLRVLSEDPELRSRMGSYNTSYGSERFCALEVTRRLLGIYERVMNRTV